MLEFDARKHDASAASAARVPLPRRSSALSDAAETAAAQPTGAAYSPIVLAGTVRLIELALIVLLGTSVYVAYVVPIDGFEWHYVTAIAGIALVAMIAFQVADIYQVQAFRGYEK